MEKFTVTISFSLTPHTFIARRVGPGLFTVSITHSIEPLTFVDSPALKLYFSLKDSSISVGFTYHIIVVLLGELALYVARTDSAV